ncbi:MAG TPA: rubredoxin [Nitrospirae bacterium]|nr:rubredoxin [Nitrospirota bacterium]
MWQCQGSNCGYIYSPEKGDKKGKIPAGTKFEELPDDWKCPVCGASKKFFKKLED